MSASSSSTRRSRATKWHPPPPPTPKILHLPRRIRLHSKPRSRPARSEPACNLRSLFVEEEKAISNRTDFPFELQTLRAQLNSVKIMEERKKIDGSDDIEKKMGKLKMRSSEIREDTINVEKLKRKMEGVSKGMMERMEEYGSMLSSTRRRTADIANKQQLRGGGAMGCRCCCQCKEVVIRIAEEVKAESEQWTEMQEMLELVRLEMEELRSSRDLWQRRAIASELNLSTVRSHVSVKPQ